MYIQRCAYDRKKIYRRSSQEVSMCFVFCKKIGKGQHWRLLIDLPCSLDIPMASQTSQHCTELNYSTALNWTTVQPRSFEPPRDRQNSSKNRGFEKSKFEKSGVIYKFIRKIGVCVFCFLRTDTINSAISGNYWESCEQRQRNGNANSM